MRKLVGGMILNTFGPIAGVMLEVYNDVTPVSLTILLKLQFSMYIICNFFVNALIERFGLRMSMWVSCIFILLGGWVRMAQGDQGNGYWVLIVSQIVAGVGTSFDYGNFGKIAITWFPKGEQARCVNILQTGALIG